MSTNSKEYTKKYRLEHLEKIKENEKRYRNSEKGKKTVFIKNKKYREKNKEYFNQYRLIHKEERAKLNKDWRIKNIDKIREYERKRRLTPKDKFLKYKSGAKGRGISFDLTFEQFTTFWQKSCYYCGSGIKTIGLDRKDNNKGYEIDNVIPCCWECNKFKSAKNYEFFIKKCIQISCNLSPQG